MHARQMQVVSQQVMELKLQNASLQALVARLPGTADVALTAAAELR